MMSRFVGLFKKNDLDKQRAFQKRVKTMLAELYPHREFTLSEDPLTLESNGSVHGLTNLKANFLLSSQTQSDLRELIQGQFDPVFEEFETDSDRNWNDARRRLMPQLMPASFLDRMALLSLPFGDEVVLGFVIDGDKAYSYVRTEEAERWATDPNELKEIALENLNQRSKGIELTVIDGDNGLFVINTLDGFDAVRILLGEMQELIAEHLGSPFYFGIPNRDFLICWSRNGDAEFQGRMRCQISSDFDERPYPLSRRAFQVTSDGDIELEADGKIDSRVSTAELN